MANPRSLKELRLRSEELAQNPSTRVPIVLCVDTSYSMSIDNRIGQMNDGIQRFLHDMARDQIAADSVELCVVAYGGAEPREVSTFRSIVNARLQPMEAAGGTHLYQGVRMAWQNLQERLQEYQESGIDYYRPWLIIIGDGNDDSPSWQLDRLGESLLGETRQKHINILAINIGDERHDMLDRLSPDGHAHKLHDLKFHEFFSWLSRNVQKMSQSLAGEESEMEPTISWEDALR